MKKRIKKLSSILLMICIVAAVSGKQLSSTDSSDIKLQKKAPNLKNSEASFLEKSIHSFFVSNVGKQAVPGAILSIYFNNEPFYILKKNMAEDSPVSIASVTKPFTAIAVMQLHEKGLIDINKNVSSYISEFHNAQKAIDEITVRHLLYQISGIPYRSRTGSIQINDKGRILLIPAPVNPPGVYFEYSNHNYILLARIIENVSGMSYSEYIKKNIFTPLNMNHSTAERSTGAGGVISTSDDMLQFVSMLASHGNYNGMQILSEEIFNQMFLPPENVKNTENMFYYGMGFRVIRSRGKTVAFYHTGIHNGTLAEIKVFPENEAFLVHLAIPPVYNNPEAEDYRWKMTGLYNHYVGAVYNPENVIKPDQLHPSPPQNDELQIYSGLYKKESGESIQIVKKGKTIYRMRNKFLEPMQPLSNIEFKSENKYYPYQFAWSNDTLLGISGPDGFYRRL